ncbi:MAG: short-subunit dehydrogenase [Arenicella sp.]|jgi:short-subunit dehydrogenase
MKYFVSTLIIFMGMLVLAPALADDHQNENKAVLITGATSGIGRGAAELLAPKGYLVYAGARKDADMKELNQIKNVTAVR